MKLIRTKLFTVSVALVAFAFAAQAQNDLNLPDVSQAATIKQRIALTDVTIDYHCRRAVNGRKIWALLCLTARFACVNENTTFEVTYPRPSKARRWPRERTGST